MDAKFSISEVFKTSWKKVKEQIWVLAGLFVAYGIVSGVLNMLLTPLSSSPVGAVVVSLISGIVSIIFSLGYIKNCFQTLDDEEPQFSAYGNQLNKILKYIVGGLLYSIAILIGTVFLVIPGIYIALRLQFYSCFIVEENLGGVEALKKSWEITKGQTWPLFLLALTWIGLAILGIICFIVGLFVAMPVTYVMSCYVYRKLTAVEAAQEENNE